MRYLNSFNLFGALIVPFIAGVAHASNPSFTNLSQGDVDSIEREMSANTALHDVIPPSTLGSIFGFEIGVVGGLTNSPATNALVQEANASASLNQLPHAALVGAVSIPFAITGEASYVPKISYSGASYQEYAAALKWTPTDGMPIPVNIAVRGFYAHSDFTFDQTLTDPIAGPVSVNVDNSLSVEGLQVIASPKLIPIIEPYIGVGYVRGNGSLNVSGNTTSTLFNFTQSQSASSTPTSSQVLVGLDVHLLLLGLGAEYSRAFGTDTYTAKLSIKF